MLSLVSQSLSRGRLSGRTLSGDEYAFPQMCEDTHNGQSIRVNSEPSTRLNSILPAQPTAVLNPVFVVAALILATSAANIYAGISFDPYLPLSLYGSAIILLLSSAYALYCEMPTPIIDGLFYGGVWCAYPVAGTCASYLAQTLRIPLQDELYTRIDRALGFDWLSWAEFVIDHPWLQTVQNIAYGSYPYQVIIILIILSRRPGQNYNFLSNLILSFVLVIAISTCLPGAGPAYDNGYSSIISDVMIQLRSGQLQNLPITGIVSFPSYHTVMAILFMFALRDVWMFWPSLVLNMLMLTAVPFVGDHYLVDMIGGGVVAASTIWLNTRFRIVASSSPCPHFLKRLKQATMSVRV